MLRCIYFMRASPDVGVPQMPLHYSPMALRETLCQGRGDNQNYN
jgi:hypothetical protein